MASETFYGNSVQALCADSVVRAATPRRYVYDGSMAGDTFFSCPAFVRVKGVTVRGFIRGQEPGDSQYMNTDDDSPGYVFHAYLHGKNWARILVGVPAMQDEED